MEIFGFTIERTRKKAYQGLSTLENRGGWWPILNESYTGAWQANVTVDQNLVLTYSAIYACVTLIASDIAKMRLRLMAQDDDTGIWTETTNPAYSPVLRKPNRYQTRLGFFQWWITSKLLHGNTYALKQRDQRGVVTGLYILDPARVRPLLSPDGSVFYELKQDAISNLPELLVTVPAREIIHDVMVPLYHPLIGVSPIYACGLAALQGIKIQENSALFFSNGSKPGGLLTAPGAISTETADRLKSYWETNFSGSNVGKIAVLGDGLKYEAMTVNADDAQLIEQLKWTAETVCSCFHVPPYMIGVQAPPNYNNIEALNQQYYAQCLQTLIEALELVLDEGLELRPGWGVEFDLDDLLRMDTATLIASEKDAIGAGIKAPNEARKRLNLPPVVGGDTPYLQQQNYSLEALNRRDQQETPTDATAPTAADVDREDETEENDAEDVERFADDLLRRDLESTYQRNAA